MSLPELPGSGAGLGALATVATATLTAADMFSTGLKQGSRMKAYLEDSIDGGPRADVFEIRNGY